MNMWFWLFCLIVGVIIVFGAGWKLGFHRAVHKRQSERPHVPGMDAALWMFHMSAADVHRALQQLREPETDEKLPPEDVLKRLVALSEAQSAVTLGLANFLVGVLKGCPLSRVAQCGNGDSLCRRARDIAGVDERTVPPMDYNA